MSALNALIKDRAQVLERQLHAWLAKELLFGTEEPCPVPSFPTWDDDGSLVLRSMSLVVMDGGEARRLAHDHVEATVRNLCSSYGYLERRVQDLCRSTAREQIIAEARAEALADENRPRRVIRRNRS